MRDRAQYYDVAIVGAGFAGLYMLHKARQLGLSARVFEAGDGVGGTWFWNRYPGARVDIESQEYCYSFSPELDAEWKWTERYAAQPELLAYLNHVADRFDLRRDIQFETRVTAATYDERAQAWTFEFDHGEPVVARYCVMATGCLSVPKDIDIPGSETFAGPTHHTGRWPPEGVDFTGKRVAVIGTGSSATQSIPEIAAQAKHLYVFQRTPNFSVPAHNAAPDPAVVEAWRAHREAYRRQARASGVGISYINESGQLAMDASPDERRRAYEARWAYGGFALVGAYADLLADKAANDTAADFVRDKICGIVDDPAVARKLMPTSYPIATKRLCVDTGYYETFNRPNVELIDLREEPIVAIVGAGVRTASVVYVVDEIVFAIGFDAMTGALDRIVVTGRGGARLKEKWSHGPCSYLGLMAAGFPNLFIVTGPGSPSVLANMALAIEQHVEWIADCIGYLRAHRIGAIEASERAEAAWTAHVNQLSEATLFPLAKSWYMGANVAGKPRVFMPYVGGLGVYRQKCDEVAASGYEGFCLESAAIDPEPGS